jgi:hypothetical protein
MNYLTHNYSKTDMHRPTAYVAGKFGDSSIADEKANRRSARQTAQILWKIGYRVIVPHSMMGLPPPSELDERGELNVDREDIMSLCLRVLSTCDCLYLMHGWERSPGSIRERQHAQRLDMPILTSYEEAKHYLENVHHARHVRLPNTDD